ncbi:histone deacetylase [Sphingomonas sp. BIUV-7]|uniref:Histone deacetylase n=1 Tax=Sphingomonas natans TaxID=3063330 RepID=A0ABT8Y8P3_9SPHN|nr:histone deacetylase [Sphingomonas sp. BIUV-7]MDO6414684.1 histone deacetylase [Sphingomonas sp. BIUV-7]
MLHLCHHPDYVVPRFQNGALAPDKYTCVLAAIRESGAPLTVHAPEPMPIEWIAAVHDPDYVEEVISAAVPAAKERRIGYAITPPIARRSRLTVGGTWLAAQLALRHGFAANGAGGSHHALPDTGAGYCVFNDLAIAANRLIAEGDVARILILDCDVHQGDGTAVLTERRDDIVTISLHADRNFPVRKARSTIDVALPDGLDDAGYLAALAGTLGPALDRYRPDLILYQAGVDPHRSDRLGRLGLSDEGLLARDRFVIGEVKRRGIPLASTLGGGYGDDMHEIGRRHAATILALAAAARDPADDVRSAS